MRLSERVDPAPLKFPEADPAKCHWEDDDIPDGMPDGIQIRTIVP